MRLSYSNYRTYLNCPRLYYNQVNKVPSDVKDSEYHSLYGRLIESFFEKHVNCYSKRDELIPESQIREIMRREWDYMLDNAYVDWSEPWVKLGSNELFEQVIEDILKNLEAFDFWNQCTSEVSYKIDLKKSGDSLTGRMDFIRNTGSSIEILDGKGTTKMDKNVDIEQLYFYALLYLLRHGKLPNKVGFLYYRYQLIKYVDINLDIITKFKNKLAIVKRAISQDKVFTPKPMLSKHCKWCKWRFQCDAFSAKKEVYASRKKNKINEKTDGQVIDLSI
ncbi:MAG: Dna2/Cas4 domain-containing protein [Candidatus Altiarchaeales archaeon]|nr:Dna2/Cas4 domain-containing protein [Candidatus Altiarchaeales archaeon]